MPSTDFLPRNVIKYTKSPTKHDGRAVLFAVAELLVTKLNSRHVCVLGRGSVNRRSPLTPAQQHGSESVRTGPVSLHMFDGFECKTCAVFHVPISHLAFSGTTFQRPHPSPSLALGIQNVSLVRCRSQDVGRLFHSHVLLLFEPGLSKGVVKT